MIPNRIKRIDSNISRLAGEAIERELELPVDVLVTISNVHTSEDLSLCKIYLAVIPPYREEEILKKIRRTTRVVSEYIFRHISLKNYPRLEFFLDKKPSEASRIEELIHKIHDSENTKEDLENKKDDN